MDSPDRLRHPLIKDQATGQFRQAGWDEALDLVAQRFTQLRDTHGGDCLAGFACARSCNEDIYMLQKMVRTVVFAEDPVARKAAKSCSPSRSRAHPLMRAKSGHSPLRTAYRSRSGFSRREK